MIKTNKQTKATPTHIIFKFQKMKYEQNISKSQEVRETKVGAKIRITSNFSENMEIKKRVE